MEVGCTANCMASWTGMVEPPFGSAAVGPALDVVSLPGYLASLDKLLHKLVLPDHRPFHTLRSAILQRMQVRPVLQCWGGTGAGRAVAQAHASAAHAACVRRMRGSSFRSSLLQSSRGRPRRGAGSRCVQMWRTQSAQSLAMLAGLRSGARCAAWAVACLLACMPTLGI